MLSWHRLSEENADEANEEASLSREIITFGDFALSVAERQLLKSGEQIDLGGRAFDLLLALVDRAGDVVSKRELMELVWQGMTVDEVALRVNIASLRKMLGDSGMDPHCIITIPGKGYCFVAPVSRQNARFQSSPELFSARQRHLPPRHPRIVGRQDDVQRLCDQVLSKRFVTIVGSGGVGKTTVAIEVGHALLPKFEATMFFDLGPVTDPLLLTSTISSSLGLQAASDDPTRVLIAYLRDRRPLVILDNCEHVIDTVAALAESIFREAPHTFILATSREPLRASGEQLWRLAPLEIPPDEAALTAEMVIRFPAVQLFVDRTNGDGLPFELNDNNAPAVAQICRQLDGIALAIEIVASRVGGLGIEQIAALLSAKYKLMWKGRRTAPARHQTLGATLDWSYDLLNAQEQAALRQLAVFVSSFTIEAACYVVEGDSPQILVALHGLASKSLLTVETGQTVARFRLLETTRSYALGKLTDSEAHQVSCRHTRYYFELIERAKANSLSIERNVYFILRNELFEIRAALEWALLNRQNVALGLALAAAAAPFLLELSLVSECSSWTAKSLEILGVSSHSNKMEMELQIHHGIASMLCEGGNESTERSLKRGLELAVQLDDKLNELLALGRLGIFYHRAGDLRTALSYAKNFLDAATVVGDPISIGDAHASLGALLHLKGDYALSRLHIDAALADESDRSTVGNTRLGYGQKSRARITLAGVLWVQGFHREGMEVLDWSVKEAAASRHPATYCMVLVAAIHILLRCGDYNKMDEFLDRLTESADKHSLAPYQAVALGMRGALLVRQSYPEPGVAKLRSALDALNRLQYNWLADIFIAEIARGLAAIGRFEDAADAIDKAIETVEQQEALYVLPEMLRIKGWILMSATKAKFGEAEVYLIRSLDLATQQAAWAWQLRTAISLATLRLAQGRPDEVGAILAPVYGRFEGEDNPDVAEARRLLTVSGNLN